MACIVYDDWWETRSCPGMIDHSTDYLGLHDNNQYDYNIRTPSEYGYGDDVNEPLESIFQTTHENANCSHLIDIADEFKLQTPDEIFPIFSSVSHPMNEFTQDLGFKLEAPVPVQPFDVRRFESMAKDSVKNLVTSLTEVCLTAEIDKKRRCFTSNLYGFKIGQHVYWSRKDAAYGVSGVVISESYHYDNPCLLIRFKGHAYHCHTNDLTTHNPKRSKQYRKENLTNGDTQKTNTVKYDNEGRHPTTQSASDSMDNTKRLCQRTSDSIASVATLDHHTGHQATFIKGRAYGRKQRLNRIRRREYRREQRQQKKIEATYKASCEQYQRHNKCLLAILDIQPTTEIESN